MKRFIPALALVPVLALVGCDFQPSSDEVQTRQQEAILQQGTAEIGMPAIKNFTERKMAKMLLELRDQPKLSTTTYTFSEVTGDQKFLCKSLGYGLPYATQYTNPQKNEGSFSNPVIIPQADPNGLFSPSSADATWVMCIREGKVKPTYVEPKIIVELN